MATYAKTTSVTIERSRQEIETTLRRYGADGIGYLWDGQRNVEVVTFRLRGVVVRLSPPQVNPKDPYFSRKENGAQLNATERSARVRQAPMQAWRALVLYVLALCEAIENRVVTVDQAFMPYVVLPNGQTVSEWAGPQFAAMIEQGKMPALLPGG